MAGCLSDPSAIDEASGCLWLSLSIHSPRSTFRLHFAFNYLRSILTGMQFINADSTESVNWNRYPLLTGGTVELAHAE